MRFEDLTEAQGRVYLALVKEADSAWDAGMRGWLSMPGVTRLPSRDWFAAARELDRIALSYRAACHEANVT